MLLRDNHNGITTRRCIAPVAIGPNATKTGRIIDTQGFGGIEFVAEYGAVTTTGTIVTLVVRDGDVTGTMASVADANLLGTEALASLLATTPRTSDVSQNVTKRIGYQGNKRYVQALLVQTGVTSVGCVAVTAVLFQPNFTPTANP